MPALARVTEQAVPLCCLRDQMVLLIANAFEQSAQLPDRVRKNGVTAVVAAEYDDDEDHGACGAKDVADQQGHAGQFGT